MNFRLALRRLRSAPGFTLAAVVTLALGIGANALAFSAIRALLVEPLPFPNGDDLVWLQGANVALGLQNQPIDGNEVKALAAGVRAIEGVAVIGARSLIRAAGNQRQEWRGLWVTPDALPLLRMVPAIGRSFVAADLHDGPVRPAMLGYERWQRDFGSDPAILGRTLQFEDKKAIAVIGVLPAGLPFPFGRPPAAGSGSEFAIGVQDFWVLGQSRPGQYPGGVAFARLGRGASLAAAQAEADAALARVPRPSAADNVRAVRLVRFRDHALGLLRPALPLLEGVAALVLLIACANVANLLLARAERTRGEFAVRLALGASRGDLLRITVAENLLIAAGGTAAGLLLAASGRALLVAFASPHLPAIDRVRLDGTAIVFAAILATVSALTLALLPARVAGDAPVASMLDRGPRGHTIGRRQSRTFRALVVVQIAITLALLNAAAIVFRSLTKLMSVDTGYHAGSVVAADVLLYERQTVVAEYFQQLHERLRAVPGVVAVGLVQSTPLTGKWTFRERLVTRGPNGSPREHDVAGSFVAFDYFEAMGIPILAGRPFTAREYLTGDRRALIINDVAARLFFPDGAAVGRELLLNDRPRDIVGVVKGTRDVRLDAPAYPQFYQPVFTGGSQVIVRTSGDAAAFTGTLRRELAASDPRLIIKRVEPLTSILESSVFERRLATRLLTVFAGLALALAVVGLYGVVNFTTTQRRREIGVRAALGARPGVLVRMVLREGVTMALTGIVIGLALSLTAAAVLKSLLFEMTARDPLTASITVVFLICTTIVASVPPAWRAASVSPALTLHAD